MIAFMLIAEMAVHAELNRDLDFWVGRWKVMVGQEVNGHDVVKKTQGGSVIREEWNGVEPGDQGESFFYFQHDKHRWKQVWVTPTGVYKEKYSEDYPGGIRFVGKVFLRSGRTIEDRTTLTKLSLNQVRQRIERKGKDGKWIVSFDAIYVPEI
jgi:hypothetical protein